MPSDSDYRFSRAGAESPPPYSEMPADSRRGGHHGSTKEPRSGSRAAKKAEADRRWAKEQQDTADITDKAITRALPVRQGGGQSSRASVHSSKAGGHLGDDDWYVERAAQQSRDKRRVVPTGSLHNNWSHRKDEDEDEDEQSDQDVRQSRSKFAASAVSGRSTKTHQRPPPVYGNEVAIRSPSIGGYKDLPPLESRNDYATNQDAPGNDWRVGEISRR